MARLVMVAGVLALTPVVLAGCGGSHDPVKVEASLQLYLGSLVPEDSPIPIGAGAPRVKDNSCKDQHVTIGKALPFLMWDPHVRIDKGLALWACVVGFGTTLATPVLVAVDDSTEVVDVVPGMLPTVRRAQHLPNLRS
jgi:uncharacterized membrane protein YedE/YeeE